MDRTRKQDPYSMEGGRSQQHSVGAGAGAGAGADASALFAVDVRDGVHVITITASNVLDAFEIERLAEELRRQVASMPAPPRVVVDLSPVHHLSSAALGMLVTIRASAQGRGGGLRLAGVRPDLRKVFELTKLDKLLGIEATVEAAAKRLRLS